MGVDQLAGGSAGVASSSVWVTPERRSEGRVRSVRASSPARMSSAVAAPATPLKASTACSTAVLRAALGLLEFARLPQNLPGELMYPVTGRTRALEHLRMKAMSGMARTLDGKPDAWMVIDPASALLPSQRYTTPLPEAGAPVGALQAGVELLPRGPFRPLAEVVDEGEDRLRAGVDGARALDAERA